MVNVPHRKTSPYQRVFKGKRTPQGKDHQIIGPDVRNIRTVMIQTPVSIHIISGHVCANVDIAPHRKHHRIAGI